MTKSPQALPVAVAVVVLFVVAGWLSSVAERPAGPRSGAEAVASEVAPIARRVERIRGLRFKQLPKPVIVTPAETQRASLAEIDRVVPASERRTGAEVLELLGLVEPGTDLREVESDVSGSEVAGYYDPRHKRLAIVSGPAAEDRLLAELTLSHELDHALDDQAIGLKLGEGTLGADDAYSAYSALTEGAATSVMQDYTRRYVKPGDALGSSLSALGASGSEADSIPPYVMSSLLFNYLAGERFVDRLREVGNGWKLVNYAFRSRPPSSTEQVIHPEKYLVNERPVALSLPPARLGPGWRRLAHGTIGEFDTDQLLKLGVSDVRAGDAAAGWGGGRYALWGSPGGARGCPDPCRRRRALVVGWTWDTRRDAAEFDAAVRLYVARGLSGRPAGAGAWEVGDGAAAVSARGLRTSLVLAPTPRQAKRLSRAAGRG